MGTVTADQKVNEIVGRIERLPLTAYQIKARLIVGIATFFDAFDIVTMSFALPSLIGAWHLKPQQIGLLLSASFIGQLIGAIFFGRLAERFGRLRTTVLTVLVFSIFSFCCAAAWNYMALIAFRLLQGIGLGGEVPVAASYINEIAKAKGRGKFVLLYELVFPIGLMIGSLAGFWIVPLFGWRWLFIIGGVPALAALYLRIALPESPRWLASKGHIDRAEKAMTKIEDGVRKALGTTELPEVKIAAVATAGGHTTRFSELFRGIYLRRTLFIWFVWFALNLSNHGIGGWLPSLYRSVFKLSVSDSLGLSLLSTFAGLLGSIAVALMIDRIGRRRWLAMSATIGGCLFAVVWLTGASRVVYVAAFASIANFFFFSNTLALYLYTPELYPTRMRTLGLGMSSAVMRVASMSAPFITGVVVAQGALPSAFLLYGGAAVAGGIVIALFGIETKGKVLEEISP